MKKFIATLCMAWCFIAPAQAVKAKDVVENYAKIVYTNYADAYRDAKSLQRAVKRFLATPTEASLEKAKRAWLISRDSYGQTEAFRFYEGPIDFVDERNDTEGPEGRLNAWPLNEAYIDYVKGDRDAGIVQDKSIAISKKALLAKNQENDEADVSTGYHAIEFLLWGQDLSLKSAGQRPALDYAKKASNERRRLYLEAVTDLLVDDLRFLVKSWKPGKYNYAKKFVSDDEAIGKMLTALATLSGFEVASERLAVPLDSNDQEDEHSCFSDNTHKDFIANTKGVENVFFGAYAGKVAGPSLYDLVKEKDADLAKALKREIVKTYRLVRRIPSPIDRELLASPKGSKARMVAEKLVASLQKQAELFKKAGTVLGVDVRIMSE